MADISSITLPGGGTYDLKDKNAVPKYGMGKNLLRNWYFVNPVNQRGLTSYSTNNAYCIDSWKYYGTIPITLQSGGIRLGDTTSNVVTYVRQFIDVPQLYAGKTLTFSVLVKDLDGTGNKGFIRCYTNNGQQASVILTGERTKFTLTVPSSPSFSLLYFDIGSYANNAFTAVAVKLELGTEQTLAHQENGVWVLNEIPDYEYELYRCITSTAYSNDTYANKSLATEQQLAYVETCTTASRAYSVGEYFCWNGLLYRVTAAISSGGTITPGTNCEQVTEGGINRVWKDYYESTSFSNLVNCDSCSTPLAVYQTLMASSKAVGYGRIGNRQTSQLKSFMTNPYANFTNVSFEFISAGLIRCTARNSSDGSILGKVCYLKGTINNLTIAWTVTDWEDVDGAIGYKEVTLTTATLGTSLSPTARLIGSASTLLGVAAEKILSIIPRDSSMSPSSNLVCGFYAGNFYLAATQSCTLNSSVKFNITYIK